jgi:MYXO-CTERM domain-containing protein
VRQALAILVVTTIGPVVASADDIVERRSSWDRSGTTIVTEEVVRRADGSVERRIRPGGTVDGIGMVQWPAEAVPHPFAPTRTRDGTTLRWAGSCVFVRPDATGTTHIPDDREHAILAGVLAHWQDATRACGYLRFELEPPEPGEVGFDQVNRIVYREDRWCRPSDPAICYPESAVGLTTLFFVDAPDRADHGTILDADIELNAVDFALAMCDGEPAGCTSNGTGDRYDLASVLTHEIGHLLGLSHACWSGDEPRGLDGAGQPLPPCLPAETLPPELGEATMYPTIVPEATSAASVESDDIAGFCHLYPVAADPGRCAPIEPPGDDEPPPVDAGGCGCASGGGGGGAAGAAALILVALLARRMRAAHEPAPRGTSSRSWHTRRRASPAAAREGSDQPPAEAAPQRALRAAKAHETSTPKIR